MRIYYFVILLLFLISSDFTAFGQNGDLPKEIRGYKVRRETIFVTAINEDHAASYESSAIVFIGKPELVDAGISGVMFALSAEIKAANQSGKVDFLTFRDFRVNGIAVDIPEYAYSFSFKKNQPVKLPKPASIFLPTTGLVQAARTEMRESKDKWTVTGRVFVFGKFRKFGFYHKRVVPIDIDITIENPLRSWLSK